ncbi:TetR/AcrR family transcriptional regulator [Kribbella pratensis]|jgi:AcrR family transcriptional regulator|uniref:TetR family transcriptional regulator n=1 Tax=Kribbella pratensis TaxID=2512112 RepID=A0A4V3GHU0_9ACTN|nr:TetR/AcrR family transcriptional regulator [Kribbella pratensis]TDW77407.1 TetR family transcriptional regulator [Kribbella pratensis]
MTEQLPQKLRSDAEDNRDRILESARVLFAREGLTVPMRAIARHAGVGPATLYRRFPTKQLLATEAFAEQIRACQAIVDEGLATPDPWQGFCSVIERICELHLQNRGFTDAFLATYPDAVDIAESRELTLKSVATLARRAKAHGRLRKDFELADLMIMLTAHRGLHVSDPATRTTASRRFATLVVQAFAAEHA